MSLADYRSAYRNREVLAFGDDPVEVMSRARESGVTEPVIVFIPERDMTFVY